MTDINLAAIRARDTDYNDVFEAQASMSKDIAHRLVAWPVHDRRALLAEVDRLRDWQRRAVDWMYASILAPGQNIRQDERQALIEEAQP